MRKRLLLMMAVTASLLTPSLAWAEHHRYSVIFEVTVDAERHVAVAVSKVIDPATGSTDAVAVKVPDSYVEAARRKIAARADLKANAHFFTYSWFDPDLPDEMNLPG
jgi:hypothetical protein